MLDNNNVKHDSQSVYYRSTVGAAEAEGELSLGLSIKSSEDIRQVLVRLWREGYGEKLEPMAVAGSAGGDERFFTRLVKLPDRGCLMWYYFIIEAASGTYFYGNNPERLGGEGMLYREVPPSYQITVYNKGAKTPDWFKHAVMYQIFPDRFYREGAKLVDKKGAVYHAHWDDAPCYYKDPDTKEIVAYDFYGGNMQGIKKKLGYLKSLGISCIYMNPIFESESNHHYDTGDYHKVDPILGTNEDFKDLLDTAKEMGIRIIIDGVFSHTGSNSKYFNREGTYDTVGAFQSTESPYYRWYNFRNFPNDYDCWWGFNTLPNVNETNPGYMDFIIHNKDSVLHHWLGQGIAGWRLDVIDELPQTFSQAFFRELKDLNREAVVIGEVWEDASNKVSYGQPREYLCGQEMDSAMNYPFRKNLFDFLMGYTDAKWCHRTMESLRENYPKENFYAMMNLIGSHDVVRAITFLGETPFYDGMPAVEQARHRMEKENFELGKARLLMAALWQMTYPGVPCIYYGDEIGMQGFKDPYNRRPYEWDKGDVEIRGWYEKFIAERNAHMALQTGELLPLYAKGDVIAYARVIRGGYDVFGAPAEDDVYVAAFNRSKTQGQAISIDVSDLADGEFADVFHGGEDLPVVSGQLHLRLQPLQGRLWRLKEHVQHYPRLAGVLLHPTSLPSRYGIGDLGQEAYDFVDFLAESGQTVWQILPLNPVGFGYSPYQSPSAFAGNPLLISLDGLVKRGFLTAEDVKVSFPGNTSAIDFDKVIEFKSKALAKAFVAFRQEVEKDPTGEEGYNFAEFCQREDYWLMDYALYQALKKEYQGVSWVDWPEPLKHRRRVTMAEFTQKLAEDIVYEKFLQYVFQRQWQRLHDYAKEKGICILGDMPIFISHDSADVWAHQKLFDLREDGNPRTVAGVPPDYFSATGQLWGNPQYDWTAMQGEEYAWWKSRFKKLYQLVDIVRIDHFRAFDSYWEIDGKAKTAMNGQWRRGPGKAFFDEIKKELGEVQIVAEDLGLITDSVEHLRDACGFPGMKVLHFSLYMNPQGRLGFVAPENSIIYTGTHDNNTTVGWYQEDIDGPVKASLVNLLHANSQSPKDICERLIEFAYASRSRMAIIPMQDLLALDSRHRMNTPGTLGENWQWRLKKYYRDHLDAKWLRALAEKYKRC
ncbi:MAG: 4-alpha-glucanotransferase [Selenomonadaceae bacterium]|nr:4-alpha-glucanotransferase [Selenomonadaceae bacterium]